MRILILAEDETDIETKDLIPLDQESTDNQITADMPDMDCQWMDLS